MDDTKRKAKYEERMKRKGDFGVRKGTMRVRLYQLNIRRLMRLDRKIAEGKLKRSECLTTPMRWRHILHLFKLKKSNWHPK